MKKASQTSREIDILTPADVRQLIELCSRRSPTGIRSRALIALLFGSGLRLAEALALRLKDLDLDALTVRVHRGKGNKPRTASLNASAVEALQRWLDKRGEFGANGRHPLFCTITTGTVGGQKTKPCKPLSQAAVRGWLARLSVKAEAVGLDKRIHAHGFRHSHAHQLRKAGLDLCLIQKQLGHANLAVTSVYLDHVGANELGEAMGELDLGF